MAQAEPNRLTTLLLMSVLTEPLLALVRRYLMPLPFLSARHALIQIDFKILDSFTKYDFLAGCQNITSTFTSNW